MFTGINNIKKVKVQVVINGFRIIIFEVIIVERRQIFFVGSEVIKDLVFI